MPREPFPSVLILLTLVVLFAGFGSGQTKPAIELDVVRCWSSPLTAAVSRLATNGTRSYASLDGAQVIALSLDGKKVWTSELGGEVVSNLVLADDSIYLATASNGDNSKSFLRVLSRETGIVGESIELPVAARHFLVGYNGSIVVVSANGVVQLIDRRGVVSWRREVAAGFVGIPAVDGPAIYVASTAKQMFTIRLSNGEIESVRKMPLDVTAVGVAGPGTMVIGDERGGLTSLAADGTAKWRFRSGARISGIFAVNGHLFVLSHDNFVYCIDVSNGNVTWKRRLAGRASHAVALDGMYALTTSVDEHSAVLTGLDSGKAIGQILLAGDEFVSADPLTAGGLVVIGTNEAIYGYSLKGPAGCPK